MFDPDHSGAFLSFSSYSPLSSSCINELVLVSFLLGMYRSVMDKLSLSAKSDRLRF